MPAGHAARMRETEKYIEAFVWKTSRAERIHSQDLGTEGRISL
jgi:hypothetical protein